MKSNHFLAAIVCCMALAACGGGGGGTSGGGPIPVTTSPPAVAYSAKIVFVGQLAGQMQSELRQVQISAPMTSSTPIPIMVISPMTSQDTIGNIGGATGFGGWVQAQVSPQPSASPSVVFQSTNPNAIFQTPQPGSTPAPLPTGVVAQQEIGSNAAAVNAQSSGTASADIGPPVNQSPSSQVYTYRAISLECVAPLNSGSAAAWAWNGTAWNAVSTAAAADIYMDGPNCDAPFKNAGESDTTIHFPGGGVLFSTDVCYCGLTASQWQNTVTSAALSMLITLNPDGSNNGEIVFKTQGGAVVKIFPNGITRGGNPDYSGAIEVSGSGVDGF